MQQPDIDTVNTTILACTFCLGMLTGGLIALLFGYK